MVGRYLAIWVTCTGSSAPKVAVDRPSDWRPRNSACAFAAAADLLYVMDYDTRSQIFAQCIAGPNAPFPGMVRGVERYLDLGIPPSKLVLGVPWYGYRYPCLPGTAPGATYCPTKQVPFRGVNCSDAAGNEVAYASLMRTLRGASGGTGGLRRDGSTGDPFFNSLESNDTNRTSTVYQYWFDDPQSLRAKYAWARSKGMLGVGPYVLNNLDPIHAANDAVEMWTAFDTFFKSEKGEKGDRSDARCDGDGEGEYLCKHMSERMSASTHG